jgi:GNAT superfamily N-acetyltransferase
VIRRCENRDFETIYRVINDAARAYEGVIPCDQWREPYMSKHELRQEIDRGVAFWGCEEEGELVAIMGLEHVADVTLIRHAYVRTSRQNQGFGSKLLRFLQGQTIRPILIGTWADAIWAIRFYERHGFRLVSRSEKDRLLKRYWSVPKRQADTSVVLADRKWCTTH